MTTITNNGPPAPSACLCHGRQEACWTGLAEAKAKVMELFREMVEHDDSSEFRVEVKPLKKGRKNLVVYSGKRYHFILKPLLDKGNKNPPEAGLTRSP